MFVFAYGARLINKIGDIELHVGDTRLLQVGPNFSRAYRNNPDFYLVSATLRTRDQSDLTEAGSVAMITAAVTGFVLIVRVPFFAAGVMVAAGFIRPLMLESRSICPS